MLCYIMVDIIRLKMKIDDSLDVFAVHGIGGMLGTVLCAWLMSEGMGGSGYDEGTDFVSQLRVQLYKSCII